MTSRVSGDVTTIPAQPILEVNDLCIRAGSRMLVNHMSFRLDERGRTGLIGESGSGKTLTALAVLGLLPRNLDVAGSIKLRGHELIGLGEREMVEIRGAEMSMIFQEPMTALNPLVPIGHQVGEPLRIHRGVSSRVAFEEAIELIAQVGIDRPERRAHSYPHELSGGQRQRALIAMALACSPDLLIADEPTTALDVTVQQQVLALLDTKIDQHHAALLMITHDLPVIAAATNNVLVMREGQLMESGATRQVFQDPQCEYTASLLAAVPPMSRDGSVNAGLKLNPMSGDTPGRTSLRSAGQVASKGQDHRPQNPETLLELIGTNNGEPHSANSGAGPLEVRPLISVESVTRSYKLRRKSLFGEATSLKALDAVELSIGAGETFGVVGESGSGKSTLARLIVGLDRPSSGRVVVDGIDPATPAGLAQHRANVQMVFQDPMASLDPRLKVGRIIAEPLRSLGIEGDHMARVESLLEAVSLDPQVSQRYPHEFSGGQRQRIAIARALAPRPKVLVADEPVSALDMSVQSVTLDLLAQLKTDFDLTVIFISHDLSVVAEICERVAVLERGRIVELGPVADVFNAPEEPYTRALIAAIPTMV